MHYTTIPNTNLKISSICLGTWVYGASHWSGADKQESIEAAKTALDNGINFIDTAPIYGNGRSEKIVGEVIASCREKVVIATKCGLKMSEDEKDILFDLKPESIKKEVEDSLRRLKIDCIDLYQCHWPDPKTPIEETMSTMVQLQKEGKIRYIGVSNFDVSLLKQAMSVAPVVSLQVQYSLLDRTIEKESLPFCREKQIGLLAYGPLGGGILTGKYERQPDFDSEDARNFFYNFFKGKRFEQIQEGLEKLKTIQRPLNQIAINWVRQQEGVSSVLVGCRTREQSLANIAAADWELTRDQLDLVERQLAE